MDAFTHRLEALWRRGSQLVTPGQGAVATMIGLDRARPGYDWDGERRITDPRGPELVIQVTIDGWGEFTDAAGARNAVSVGSYFCCVIPSRHRYRLPSAAPGWRFWWTQILHPDAVARGAAAIAERGHVHRFDPAGPLAAALLDLTAAVRGGRHRDELALERDALTVAIELQRDVRAADGSDQAWALEAAVRDRVMGDLTHPPDLNELAAADGRERSAYAHRFRSLVGTSPGRYVAGVRMEVVRRALEHGDQTLDAIATRVGFADANHLCKVFRRHHGTSPGVWRQRQR